MKKRLLVILDSGHGGMVNGQYTTAPSKMHEFGNGEIAYEGVINRRVKSKLMELLLQEGIAFKDVTEGNYDISLFMRTTLANNLYDFYRETHEMLYLSIHSNAGGGSGFEVWTSPGQTMSDQYAEIWSQELKKTFPGFPFRAHIADGDLDKEEKFYVLVHTIMPAVLGELLFFDNYKDYKVIQHPFYVDQVAQSIINFLKRAQKELL